MELLVCIGVSLESWHPTFAACISVWHLCSCYCVRVYTCGRHSLFQAEGDGVIDGTWCAICTEAFQKAYRLRWRENPCGIYFRSKYLRCPFWRRSISGQNRNSLPSWQLYFDVRTEVDSKWMKICSILSRDQCCGKMKQRTKQREEGLAVLLKF